MAYIFEGRSNAAYYNVAVDACRKLRCFFSQGKDAAKEEAVRHADYQLSVFNFLILREGWKLIYVVRRQANVSHYLTIF